MPADLNDYFKKNSSGGNGGGGNNINFQPPQINLDGKKMGFIYALIAVVALVFLSKPFVIIESGEVGVKATAGKYDPIPLLPGFHVLIPFLQKAIVLDTREKVMEYSSSASRSDRATYRGKTQSEGIIRKGTISVLDERGLTVSIDMTIQYKLLASTAPQTLANYGLEWERKIIDPVVKDAVKNVAGNYTAEELPIKRNEISALIKEAIISKIELKDGAPADIKDVLLRDIILPQEIKNQIERVQVAKQQAQRTKYEVERAQQEAEKVKALERGKAAAVEIKAKGKALAIEVEAKAKAKANKLISDSLSKQLLTLKQIEVQGKFNEALKINKDAKIFLTPGGAVPNIWVDMKDKKVNSSIR